MAASPPKAITLHPCHVLFEPYTDTYVSGIGNVSVGSVLLVGKDVKDWSAGDIVLFDKDFSYQFRTGEKTYAVIHTDKILVKYILEEPQHRL